MYQIIRISDGEKIGITDSIRYIKLGKSGSYATAKKEDAIGVAYNGTAYNLHGYNEIEGASSVVVSEIDSGKLVLDQMSDFEKALKAVSEECTNQIMLKIEDAVRRIESAIAQTNKDKLQ